jgi:hypothetical protein
MKKLVYIFAFFAMFLAVNTVKAQSNLPASVGKVILVKLDASAMSEARGKIMGVLTVGKLNGYIKAEQSYLVTIPDNAAQIQTTKDQILSVYPAAVLSVVTVNDANQLIAAQRNSNSNPH